MKEIREKKETKKIRKVIRFVLICAIAVVYYKLKENEDK